MSLDLCVGLFAIMEEFFDEDPEELRAYRQVFADINSLLREAGLPEHHEREGLVGDLGGVEIPWSCALGPYGTLQCLRRFYAHVLDRRGGDQALPVALPGPVSGGRATDDPLLRRAYESEADRTSPFHRSHLIQHADDCGYYVPIDFPEPLGPYPFPGLKVWERLESTLGSSFGLLRECQDAAMLLVLYHGSMASIRTGLALGFV